jgi:hypothetical protein
LLNCAAACCRNTWPLDAVVGAIERRLMIWQPKAGETEKV